MKCQYKERQLLLLFPLAFIFFWTLSHFPQIMYLRGEKQGHGKIRQMRQNVLYKYEMQAGKQPSILPINVFLINHLNMM